MGEQTEAQELELLIQAAARGDVAAQSALLERYWPLIRRTVRARRQCLKMADNPREDTDDAMQDAALRLLRRLPELEWQGATAFGAWIRRLATAQVHDAARFQRAQRRRFSRGEPVDGTDSPTLADAAGPSSAESYLDRRRELAQLAVELRQLKDTYAMALVWRSVGYTHAQVAQILGCSEEAARKLESRARAALAKVRGR